MYTFTPTSSYKYATKLGDFGESVAALQVNLVAEFSPITTDGAFGPQTQGAVKALQQRHGLVVDGIAGPVTQKALCLDLTADGHAKYAIPSGLLKGIIENESGYILAAYTAHPSGPGFDIGPYQDAFPPRPTSQANYKNAYDCNYMSLDTASSLRAQKDIFIKDAFAGTNQRAWQLATLYHNWPFAAVNLAKTGHIYPNNVSTDTSFAQWVYDASGGSLSTPLEWANAYITKACKYVTLWTT